MDASPGSEQSRAHANRLVLVGLILVAALLLWFLGQEAGLWLAPAPLSPQDAPLAVPTALPDIPVLDQTLDEPTVLPEPGVPVRLYLPVLSAGPSLPPPVARVQAVAAQPAGEPPLSAPLSLPDPRLDIPPLPVRGRLARLTRTPAAFPGGEGPAGVGGPAAVLSDGQSTAVGATSVASTSVASTALLSPGAPSRWLWPVPGRISQSFSPSHPAIDIVTGHGALVVAADGGEVVYAEWEISGFGYLVVVDHGDDYRSYYGHLYGFYVDVGQRVERGDLLGQLGTTGNSTGPHLHFEMRHKGLSLDPLKLLPPRQQ